MPITTKQLVGFWEVTLEGEITLPCIAELRERLLEALNGTDHISLDMARVLRLDLSCLQAFCAMHKTSIAKEKEVSFSAPFPSVVKETLQRTGYWTDAGCHRRMKGDCLLKGVSHG